MNMEAHRLDHALDAARKAVEALEAGTKQSDVAAIAATAPAARALLGVLDLVYSYHRMLITSKLQRLSLRPGDVLLAKLGDPDTGWIPPADAGDRFQSLIEAALKDAKVDAPVVIWNYAIEVEAIDATQAKKA